jgi:hypothetical protein
MVQNTDKPNKTRTGSGRKTTPHQEIWKEDGQKKFVLGAQQLQEHLGHCWIVGRIGEHCTAVIMCKETFALQESNKDMYFAT